MTTKNAPIVRATQVELVAQVVRFGQNPPVVCETQPRPLWAVSVDHGKSVEVIAILDSEERAVEAAEALERQLKAELGTDGAGLKLATRDGQVLQ